MPNRRSLTRCHQLLFALLALSVSGSARAQCDTTPPNLTAFNFSPSSVNTTSAAQNVTCNMTLADAPAGVFGAACSFQYIDFGTGTVQVRSCSATTGVGGVYSCVVSLPRYAAAGTWKASVSAFDTVGNQKAWTEFDLLVLGFPTNLVVTSDPDVIAPNITALSFTPNSVNVSSGSANVTCTMTLTDAKAGVDVARCFFSSPSGSGQATGCASNTLKSGTRNNGVFECVMSIPRYSDAAVWKANVSSVDLTGNSSNFDSTTLQGRGFPVDLTVTSVPEDVAAPVQTSFDFNPKTADSGSGPTSITCSFGFTDNPAGVAASSCDFNFTDNSVFPPVSQSIGCSGSVPASGTRQSGTMTCNVTLPRYSAPGGWVVESSYSDQVGNSGSFPVAPLLNVTCGGDPEASLQFANDTTLTWGPIAGASRYNIYRGTVNNLPTTYGTCQNSRDPVLTDTQFVDTELPTPAGRAFHYLVSYTASGVEKGLGKRSNGTPRTVSPPCP